MTHLYTTNREAMQQRRLEEGMVETAFAAFLQESKQSFRQLLLRRRPSPSEKEEGKKIDQEQQESR